MGKRLLWLTFYADLGREAMSEPMGQVYPGGSIRRVPISAAKTVLELALKGVELEDLAVRVEELELQATRV